MANVSDRHGFLVPVHLGERRLLHPGKLQWARAIGWMVFLIFAVALAYGPTAEFLSNMLPKQPALQFVAHVVGCVIILGTYSLLVGLGENRAPTELSLTAAPLGLLIGAVIGAAMFAAVMAIMAALQVYDVKFIGPASAWRGATLALQSGVFEEVLVRGIVFRLMWRAIGPWWALAISAAVFGAGHIFNPGATAFSAACVAIEAGIMLAAFYAWTGRLWAPIGLHAAWNFTQGYVFGAVVSGGNFGPSIARSTAHSGHPDWITGGAFGPEASLPALCVCLAVGLTTLWAAWRAGQLSGRDIHPALSPSV